jgi:hypothetical protein
MDAAFGAQLTGEARAKGAAAEAEGMVKKSTAASMLTVSRLPDPSINAAKGVAQADALRSQAQAARINGLSSLVSGVGSAFSKFAPSSSSLSFG